MWCWPINPFGGHCTYGTPVADETARVGVSRARQAWRGVWCGVVPPGVPRPCCPGPGRGRPAPHQDGQRGHRGNAGRPGHRQPPGVSRGGGGRQHPPPSLAGRPNRPIRPTGLEVGVNPLGSYLVPWCVSPWAVHQHQLGGSPHEMHTTIFFECARPHALPILVGVF